MISDLRGSSHTSSTKKGPGHTVELIPSKNVTGSQTVTHRTAETPTINPRVNVKPETILSSMKPLPKQRLTEKKWEYMKRCRALGFTDDFVNQTMESAQGRPVTSHESAIEVPIQQKTRRIVDK
jgi:hypothetical protein